KTILELFFLLIVVSISSQSIGQSINDKEVLTNLVNTFLDKVDSKEMHDRFWAEDLIYTSSSGKRFGKETIMEGFTLDSDTESSDSSPTYSAEEIQIQLHGEVAVVAFKLVSKNPQDNSVSEYLNSGTFVKRNHQWVVVSWQATKISTK
ncbi:MAG: nuclear transport factor 2 family protein, partial [Cyclobacteriaceae bacterium]|nr:nuclear transport factor 2 family protein [Cyclobacteriaceae bacterium]